MSLLSDLHDRIWFKEDTPEVTRIKSELRDAFFTSQHPPHTGTYMYRAVTGSGPSGFKPLIIQLQPIGPDEAKAPLTPIEDLAQLSPARQAAYYQWEIYERQLADAKKQMDEDHKTQVDAVMRMGELQRLLADKIGKRAMQEFCYSLTP